MTLIANILLVICGLAAALLYPADAYAVPASPDMVVVEQPDGNSFPATINGDEFQNWMETTEGYTVVKNRATKFWEYAVADTDGTLAGSDVKVEDGVPPPSGTKKHLKPARDDKRASRATESIAKNRGKRDKARGRKLGKDKKAGKKDTPEPGASEPGPSFAQGEGGSGPSLMEQGAPGDWNPYPVSGSRNVLIILTGFADRPLVTSPSGWYAKTFSTEPNAKSVANFYLDNSFGTMSVSPAAHTQSGSPPGIVTVQLASDHPNYGGDITYAPETAWLNEALSLASAYVDFPYYDTDSDGTFDNTELIVYFVTAGYEAAGTAKTPSIWAHAWGGDGVTAGGVNLVGWAMNGELNDAGLLHPMGVIAHELGHSMCGLPDLYDTSYANSGLGAFSAMASGSWGKAATDVSGGTTPSALDAWSRQYLGWSVPREPVSGTVGFGPALGSTDAPVKLVNPSVSTTQYFLVENRYPTGWDKGMERWLGQDWGGGLLIIHVDITVGTSFNDGSTGNNDINRMSSIGHQGVMAEEAVTTFGALKYGTSMGHVTHLFYEGNKSDFAPGTSPGSGLYEKTATGLALYTISARGQNMTASMDPDPDLPSSSITSPAEGAYVNGAAYPVTGTSSDNSGTGILVVDISTDGGSTWASAADASGNGSWSTWSYSWTLPFDGMATVMCRATDNSGGVEVPVSAVNINVDNDSPVTSASPPGGRYLARQWVSLSSDKSAVIYYTTDGSEPTTSSAVYTSPILVDSSSQLKHFGVSGGGNTEAVVTESYVIDPLADWVVQDGTAYRDSIFDVVMDTSGNSYMVASTDGGYDGNTNSGYSDLLVIKTGPDGGVLWSVQYGSAGYDYAGGIALGTDGVYVSADTDGSMPGFINAGLTDLFLMKLDFSGNVVWTRQLGSTDEETVYGLGVDSAGNAYVGGYTWGSLDGNTNLGYSDIFVVKYDTAGNKQWTVQRGTDEDDWVYDMDVDPSGNICIGGDTWGALDGETNQSAHYDAYVMKLDNSGTWQWTRQYGDGYWSTVYAIEHDASGNVFAGGFSYGSLKAGYTNAGDRDLYVAKFDSDGTLSWLTQAGSDDTDYVEGLSIDGYGNIMAAGETYGVFGAYPSADGADVLLLKLAPDGGIVRTVQFGSSENDFGVISLTSTGAGLYLFGNTYGGLDGNVHIGDRDMYWAKIDIAAPYSDITFPADRDVINRSACTITGFADDESGSGVTLVEVSTDGGGSWSPATGTASWSYDWSIPGTGTYNIRCRATDALSNVETPGPGISVSVDNNTLASSISDPSDGASLTSSLITITGAASGSGLSAVEVSTDGGSTWAQATGTSSWSYEWTVPGDGTYILASRAADSSANYESPYDTVEVSVDFETPVTTAAPVGGTYQTRQFVSLAATEPSDIRYTTDGTEPDAGSPLYTGDMLLSSDTELKFFAADAAGHSEAVNTGQYLITPAAEWTSLSGTAHSDYAFGVAADPSGNVYVVGDSEGTSSVHTGYGYVCFAVSKLDGGGNLLWHKWYGSSGYDYAKSAATDASGNLYVSGYSNFTFEGNAQIGGYDAVVMKLAPDGTVVWSRQFGTDSHDYGRGVAVDASGNVYVGGDTYGALEGCTSSGNKDVFLVKLDADGNTLWRRQTGTDNSDGGGYVALDPAGNAFIACSTPGTFTGQTSAGITDTVVIKYDPSGTMQWTRQTGTSAIDDVRAVASDALGNVYLAGYTAGSLHGNSQLGGNDGFLIKYGPDGARLWTRLVGSSTTDYGLGVATDGLSTVCVSGYTYGGIGGVTNPGLTDAFVAFFGLDGRLLRTVQAGTVNYEYSYAAYGSGYDFLVAGNTKGRLDGSTGPGGMDFFVMKFAGSAGMISSISYPGDGTALKGSPIVVTGSAADPAGTGIQYVELSTDGGSVWNLASDTSGDGSWSSWEYSWTPPSDGTYQLVSRATDILDAQEIPGAGITVTVDNVPPTSYVYLPTNGSTVSGTYAGITAVAEDTGSGISVVEVSPDGGASWHTAVKNPTNWYYSWKLPIRGTYQLFARATDNAGNQSTPGAPTTVTVVSYGSRLLPHYDWDAALTGGDCTVCHEPPSEFVPVDFRDTPGFCNSCHNTAGVAHGRITGPAGHSVFASVTSAGVAFPTYGNMTSVESDNRPYAHLYGGDKVVCTTCHNPMGKPEDYGRSWEYTTTSDRYTYTMQYGAWSAMGRMVPRVYRDTSLWTGPSEARDRADYLVDPSEYRYDETAGKITFRDRQPDTAYIFVGLDYPYLRASSQDDRLCSDCHTQATHQGANCLTCHTAHGSANLAGIRETLRTPDRLELPVVFTNRTGANSFADGDWVYDGICEVCHTATMYNLRDGSGFANHTGGINRDGTDCASCHTHASGFAR